VLGRSKHRCAAVLAAVPGANTPDGTVVVGVTVTVSVTAVIVVCVSSCSVACGPVVGVVSGVLRVAASPAVENSTV
jgi:hypothetical protein